MSRDEMTERSEKYWICNDCASKKNWEPVDYAVTIIKGLCGWCERKDETFLTPTCDYTKPGQAVKVWD